MTEIESRIEEIRPEPDYGHLEFDPDKRARGAHRSFVGGMWDEIGQHQFDFLLSQGLQADELFLDVGCGALRAGRLLVDYLEQAHYYGIDINKSLIVAGYEDELDDAQRARLPLANLRHTDRFDADFGVQFDMGIAQSLFTHISLNNARLCLHRVAKVMRPGGRFYVTFFESRPGAPIDSVQSNRFGERNPYWYYRSDMRWIAKSLPWKMRYIGDWDHPRNQRMVEYTRMSDEEFAAAGADRTAAPARGRGLRGRLRTAVRGS